MFARRMFPGRYFAPTYFPPVVGEDSVPTGHAPRGPVFIARPFDFLMDDEEYWLVFD
jgi:hypothetical protein